MTTGISRILVAPQSLGAGGMETHAIDLAVEYARRGLAVAAVLPTGADYEQFAHRLSDANVAVTRLDTDTRRGRVAQVRALWRFVRTARRFRPDVVHIHTGRCPGALALVTAARLGTSARVVLSEHNVPDEHPSRRQRIAGRLTDRLVHALVAISRRNAGLRRARLGAPGRRFAAVLNGVPAPELSTQERDANRAAARSAHGIAADAVVLGSIVRLADDKGLDDLLRAFAIVRAAHACKLLLVGDGPMRAELEQLAASLGVSGDIVFAGHQADPRPYMDALDAFVLAVPAGSGSIALLETMARGVPATITFCGPEEAVIDSESGLCAPPNDPKGLAAVLARLAGDAALRERLGRDGAAHVRRHFSVQRVADDMLAVYADARAGAIRRRLRADGPLTARPGDSSD